MEIGTVAMRVLSINPNTTTSITDLVAREVSKIARPDVAYTHVTGRFGARYIASRAAYAVAGHAALDAFAEHGAGADGVLLACFGDPALDALREMAGIPVVGLADAAMAEAALRGRFAVVTGGAAWGPMLTEFAAGRGHGDRLVGVLTVAPSGAEIARDPDGSLALLAEACARGRALGADTVILGGAGLAGLKARLRPLVGVPLIDGLEAGVAAIEAAIRPGGTTGLATPPVETIGLGDALRERFAGRGGRAP